MARKVAFKLLGGDKVLKGLVSMSKNVREEVRRELSAAADNIVVGATSRVEKNYGAGGGLATSIEKRELSKYKFEVQSLREYSAYVEFGTGAYVKVPKGLESYAMQFKGQGLRDVNLPARPFFFNTFEEERVELIKRLKEIIKNATN